MIICFKMWADYGHFSHPATIYSSLTYPIPPKTTVMGMLGAIIGLDKMDIVNPSAQNNYNLLNKMQYSVIIKQLKGKKNFTFNGVKNALPSIKPKLYVQKIKQRKQFYRELLINPSYEIYLDFSRLDSEIVFKIIKNLQTKKSIYPLYMGINFCLANFEYVGDFSAKLVNADNFVDIHSFVPLPANFKIEPNRTYSDIRIATSIDNGRLFGNFKDLLVETTGKPIKVQVNQYYNINEKNLIFI